MNESLDGINIIKFADLLEEDRRVFGEIVEGFVGADFEDLAGYIDATLKNPDQLVTPQCKDTLVMFLFSLKLFALGMQKFAERQDFNEAYNLFLQAVEGFEAVGESSFITLATGFATYVSALVELHNLNISKAVELMERGRSYFNNAGRYISTFENIVDTLEPEVFFFSGIQAAQSQDFVTAETLIEKAIYACQRVARNNNELKPLFLSQAKIYKAIFKYSYAFNEYSKFGFDKVVSMDETIAAAREAASDLSNLEEKNAITETLSYTAELHAELLQLLQDMSIKTTEVLISSYKTHIDDLDLFKNRIARIKESGIAIQPGGILTIRMLDQMSERLDNLKSLAEKRRNPYFTGKSKIPNNIDIFLAMPFDDAMKPIYDDHIKVVAERLNLRIVRADDFFSANSVIQSVWDGICSAKIVVADCTSKNANVFYEIGLAHAIGKPVLIISQDSEDVPFDITHIRYIQYDFTPRGMKTFEINLETALRTELGKSGKQES